MEIFIATFPEIVRSSYHGMYHHIVCWCDVSILCFHSKNLGVHRFCLKGEKLSEWMQIQCFVLLWHTCYWSFLWVILLCSFIWLLTFIWRSSFCLVSSSLSRFFLIHEGFYNCKTFSEPFLVSVTRYHLWVQYPVPVIHP